MKQSARKIRNVFLNLGALNQRCKNQTTEQHKDINNAEIESLKIYRDTV